MCVCVFFFFFCLVGPVLGKKNHTSQNLVHNVTAFSEMSVWSLALFPASFSMLHTDKQEGVGGKITYICTWLWRLVYDWHVTKVFIQLDGHTNCVYKIFNSPKTASFKVRMLFAHLWLFDQSSNSLNCYVITLQTTPFNLVPQTHARSAIELGMASKSGCGFQTFVCTSCSHIKNIPSIDPPLCSLPAMMNWHAYSPSEKLTSIQCIFHPHNTGILCQGFVFWCFHFCGVITNDWLNYKTDNYTCM